MLKFTQAVTSYALISKKRSASRRERLGPYAQYAVVRAASIFREGWIDSDVFSQEIGGGTSPEKYAEFLNGESGTEIWELWLAASKTSYIVVDASQQLSRLISPSMLFNWLNFFNTFYHRHPILNEPDEKRKQFLLTTVAVVRRELIRTLAVMGITVPPVM